MLRSVSRVPDEVLVVVVLVVVVVVVELEFLRCGGTYDIVSLCFDEKFHRMGERNRERIYAATVSECQHSKRKTRGSCLANLKPKGSQIFYMFSNFSQLTPQGGMGPSLGLCGLMF